MEIAGADGSGAAEGTDVGCPLQRESGLFGGQILREHAFTGLEEFIEFGQRHFTAAVGVERIDGLQRFERLAQIFARAGARGPETLQIFDGFFEERADGLVDVALGVIGKALGDLCGGDAGLAGGLEAGRFCGGFLVRGGAGGLLDALLEIQQAFHVGVVRGLIVFFLDAAAGRDDLLGGLEC